MNTSERSTELLSEYTSRMVGAEWNPATYAACQEWIRGLSEYDAALLWAGLREAIKGGRA